MAELFNRAWSLQIDTILIDGQNPLNDTLDIEFNITKNKKREPDKIDIKVYNLNPTHRGQIQAESEVAVILKAGYVDNLSVIFSGDMSDIEDIKTGTDIVTLIEGEDGGTAYRRTAMARSFPDGTSVLTVLKAAIEGMGIGIGNLRDFSSLAIDNMGETYPEGTVLTGPPRDAVNRIVRSIRDTDSPRTRYSWSIKNGNFLMRRGRQPVRDRAILLTPQTGLLESPTKNKPQRGKPQLTNVKSLLIPGIFPGRIIQLDSELISGNFAVHTVAYKGSTLSNDWLCDMQLEAY